MLFEIVLMFTGFVSNNKLIKSDLYLHCPGKISEEPKGHPREA